jgi:hypothetical protein
LTQESAEAASIQDLIHPSRGLFLEDLDQHRDLEAQQLEASTLHVEESVGEWDTGCDIAGCYIQFPTHVLVVVVVMRAVHLLQIHMLQAAAPIVRSGLVWSCLREAALLL